MSQKYCYLFFLLLVKISLFPSLVKAQNVETPQGGDLIQPHRETFPEIQTPSPLPPLDQLFPSPDPSLSPSQPSLENIPGEIKIKRFEFEGNTAFSDEELSNIIKDYLNQPLSFARLIEIQEKITTHYISNNYISSGAYIPPQTLNTLETSPDNIKTVEKITIEIIEGSVSQINIEGLWRLNPNYVKERIEIGSQTPLNQERLLTSLQMLQLDPLIETISAELAAGIRPGESILDVKVREADASSARLSLDNQRAPSVGSVRRQIEFNHNNFLGWGDRFSVAYLNTDGSDSLDHVSYTIPINAHNGTLGFSHSRSESDIIEAPFNILDIQSKSQNYEFTLRQPLIQTPNQEFALGLTSSWQESQTSLLNIPFPLSRGANDQGETRIYALRFFQEYTQRNEKEVFALRSQFNLGLGGAFNSTINNDEPDSSFLSWRGQAQYLTLLGSESIFLLRSDLQLAQQPLVPLEQFSAGGAVSVRGYRQDLLLADNGLFASAEVRTPILKIPQWDTTVQLTPFLDFATIWNSDQAPLETQTISSVGVGLRFLVGNIFNARLDWGIPLTSVERRGNSLQENGLYFTLEFFPF
jgi:hemolysin activation/secretion protein